MSTPLNTNRPYDEIRRLLAARGYDGATLAKKLGRSAGYVSERWNNKRSWEIDDCYRMLELAGAPHQDVYIYFAPNGRYVEPEQDRDAAPRKIALMLSDMFREIAG